MKKCESCGFVNVATRDRCLKCGAVLEVTQEDLPRAPKADGIHLDIMPSLRRALRRLSTDLFVSPLPSDLPFRQPWIAGFLGLLPGLGQLYNHRYKKALWRALFYFVLVYISVITIKAPYSNFILVALGSYVLWGFNDAFVDACVINGQRWSSRNSWALFFAELFLFAFYAIVSQFIGSPFVKFLSVRQPGFSPFFEKYDRVIVETVSYIFREPKRGDVVFYEPGRFSISHGDDMILINEKRSFERVLGVPGDEVESRNGEYFLNGKPMPEWMRPIGNCPPKYFKFKAPPGNYILIFSHAPEEQLKIMGFVISEGKAPRLDSCNLEGWDKVCVVPIKDIEGRVVCVYGPPQNRRWLTPPKELVPP